MLSWFFQETQSTAFPTIRDPSSGFDIYVPNLQRSQMTILSVLPREAQSLPVPHSLLPPEGHFGLLSSTVEREKEVTGKECTYTEYLLEARD